MSLSIHKYQLNSELISGIILGASILVGGAYFLHPFTVEDTHASDTTISVSHTSESWHVDAPTSTAATVGGIDFDITSTPDGTHVAKKDTVTGGNTNVPDYQIYVSVDTTDGKMPATSGDAYIAATSGTVTDATDSSSIANAAALSDNSWGFALDSFASIAYDDLLSSSTADGWASSKWAKLPYVASASVEDKTTVESNAVKIYDSTSDNSGSVNIYYAVHANNDLAAGEYETTVTYTLIGDIPSSGNTMQSMDAAACQALTDFSTSDVEGTTYEVTDSRDNTPYYIRKFTFGGTKYCTMVENLNLAGGTAISYKDSNIEETTKTYLPGTGAEATGEYTLPASSDSGFSTSDNSNAAQRMYDGNGRNRDGAKYNNNAVDGAYYNWQVATAGTGGYYGYNRTSNGDICPKNWRLPTNSEQSTIASTINSLGLTYWYTNSDGTGKAAASSVLSGYMGNSTLGGVGDVVVWWSSTQNTANGAYYLRDVGDVYTFNGNKYGGFSVRCLLPASSGS